LLLIPLDIRHRATRQAALQIQENFRIARYAKCLAKSKDRQATPLPYTLHPS
jgi:hypothetical protein